MRITRLFAENLRQFDQLLFEPGPRLNVFCGANAAGKTTVLEAAYLACRADSFRARKLDEVIQETRAFANISMFSQADTASLPVNWRLHLRKGEVEIQRFEQPSSRKELALASPATLVDRHLHRIFEDGPAYRRRYLDWGLFYVEPSFFNHWRRYERALRQRNSALRSQASNKLVQAWDTELLTAATAIQGFRQSHIRVLEIEARKWLSELLDTEQFEFQLSSGWDEKIGLEAALAAGLIGDRKAGFTHSGPHRAELRIRFEQKDVRRFTSRGQQKMLSVAMALAQASLVSAELSGAAPVILLDDLEAELSKDWQARLIAALQNYPGQCLLTSLEWSDCLLSGSGPRAECALFHVEHGVVTPDRRTH